MQYRKDIDGLRGVAVSAVVLFHAGFPGFSGGFVGVDIFFVISGFLITGIIINDLNNGNFTITNFYMRRVLRILPALMVVCVFCFLAGLAITTPPEFKAFGESLTDSALFISNYYFHGRADYFDAAAHTKPLLHTWSLSIEEQFYMIWPVALILLWQVKSVAVRLLIIILVAAASLAYAEWKIAADHPETAFYLLPARGWELMLGAVLAIIVPGIKIGRMHASLLGILGLVLILSSIVFLSPEISFPGIAAIPACLGTAMLIAAGHRRQPLVACLYSNHWIVGIGLISYSLYLWHWPIFSYWKLLSNQVPGTFVAVLLILLSVALAFLSYRFIEQPFRKSHESVRQQRVLQYGFASAALAALVGFAASGTNGLPQRFGPAVAAIYDFSNQKPLSRGCSRLDTNAWLYWDCVLGASHEGQAKILLAGDSHATHFAPGINVLLKRANRTGQLLSRSGCPPLTGTRLFNAGREKRKCIDFFKQIGMAIDREESFDLVILAARWSVITEDTWRGALNTPTPSLLTDDQDRVSSSVAVSRRVLERNLRRTVEVLTQKGTQVVLMGQVPPFTSDPVGCVVRARMHSRQESECFVSAEKVRERLAFANKLLKDLAAEYEGTYSFIPSELLCDEKSCSPFLNKTFIYRDDDHLNVPGAVQLAAYLETLSPFSALHVAHSSLPGSSTLP